MCAFALYGDRVIVYEYKASMRQNLRKLAVNLSSWHFPLDKGRASTANMTCGVGDDEVVLKIM